MERAHARGVPRSRISEIIRGAPITADTGLRLSRYFGMSDGFWINLQADYDMQVALVVKRGGVTWHPHSREPAML